MISLAKFVVGISVGLLVLAIIGRVALNVFFSADTSSFDADSLLIWVLIPVVFLLAVALRLLNTATEQT